MSNPFSCRNLILPKTRTGLHKDLVTPVNQTGNLDLVWTEKTQKEIEKLYLLSSSLPSSFIPTEYQTLINTVFPIQQRVLEKRNLNQIPWALVMPTEQFKTAIVEFLKLSVESLNGLDLSYYVQHWNGHQSFLKKVLEHSEIQYEQLGTVTGRLVVKQGLDLLRVKREDRANTLVSHNKKVNNSENYKFIYELDFKCLEPRVILATTTKNKTLANVPDIYKSFQEEFFPSSSREEVKQAIISKLYGKLGGQKQLETIVEEEFGLKTFKEGLVNEEKQNREKHGFPFIVNKFERRVSTLDALPYMFPVYYTQSTAVDVALKGFAQLLEVNEWFSKTRILGLIHDAMYLASTTKIVNGETTATFVTISEFPEIQFHLGIKEIN